MQVAFVKKRKLLGENRIFFHFQDRMRSSRARWQLEVLNDALPR